MTRAWKLNSARALALIPIIAWNAACDAARVPTERAAGVTIAIDTVEGVEMVRSSGDAPLWLLDTMIVLGSRGDPLGEPQADEFAWVSAAVVGPDDELFVADLGNDEIRVFDFAGNLKRRIGREGAGPGEFRTLHSIQWLGDTLVTLDHGNGRIAALTPDGTWLRPESFVGRLTDSPVTTRLYTAGPSELYFPTYRTTDDLVEAVWSRYGMTSAKHEWPRVQLPVTPPFPDKVVCTMGRGFSWFDHPYATRALDHPAPGGQVYQARTDAYRIILASATGDTVRVIERVTDPTPVSAVQWQPIVNRFHEWLEDKDPTQCRPPSLTRPQYKPALEGIMVDAEGRLWVESNMEDGTRWEVFDLRGQLIAQAPGLNHDRQRTVPWFGTEYVAWVSRGQLDVPRVEVARLVK